MDQFYFDYAATTPIAPEVAHRMIAVMTSPDLFGNPSSTTHPFGWKAQVIIENARQSVAQLIGCKPRECTFTSGATESNNMVLQGVVKQAVLDAPARAIHIITSAIEHKSILDTCEALAQLYPQLTVTYLPPNRAGIITAEQVSNALTQDTILVSLMHVNNEIGSINPIEAIGKICLDAGVFFHVDAAQSVGKLPLHVAGLPIDALTFSGHKFYGPKGVGGLYLRHQSRLKMSPLVFGGGQERKIRPGTLATHQIEGLAAACALAATRLDEHDSHIRGVRSAFLDRLRLRNLSMSINGPKDEGYPGILNLHLPKVDADSLMLLISHLGASTGSACNSQQKEGSHVLAALGVQEHTANLRFSFGWNTTTDDATRAADALLDAVAQVFDAEDFA